MNWRPQNENQQRPDAPRLVLVAKQDIDEVRRLLALLAEGTPAEAVLVPGMPRPVTRQTLLQAARDELTSRRRRAQIFSQGMFGEPAWEMLLTLYAEQRGRRFTIARLTSSLSLPGTTAHRWLNYLQEKQLVSRQPHPTDQRSVFIQLTANAIEALDSYFAERLTRTA